MTEAQHDPIADLLARFGPPLGNPVLVRTIRDEIARGGPITFARFMDVALYDVEHGYYATQPATIGATGDFATSPEVHPLFGWLLAVLAALLADDLGNPILDIAEFGGGTGTLAVPFVVAGQILFPDRFSYQMIDVSTRLRARQRERLEAVWPRGRWSVGPPGSVSAAPDRLIIANELLDALPFHRLVRTGAGWNEVLTGVDGDRFVDVPAAIQGPAVQRLAARLPVAPVGTRAEVSPATVRWLEQQARLSNRGGVLVVDYGGSTRKLVASGPSGTMRTFHRHTVGSNPYVRVGEQDVTASVDFDLVGETLARSGLVPLGPVSQATLLRRLVAQPEADAVLDAVSARRGPWARAFDMLTDEDGLGAFHCLLAGRGLPPGGRTAALFATGSG